MAILGNTITSEVNRYPHGIYIVFLYDIQFRFIIIFQNYLIKLIIKNLSCFVNLYCMKKHTANKNTANNSYLG